MADVFGWYLMMYPGFNPARDNVYRHLHIITALQGMDNWNQRHVLTVQSIEIAKINQRLYAAGIP